MYKYRNKSGYTLVDTIVSLALFSIVILVCSGVLVTIVNANRKERSLKQAMDNLNVVIENISRTLKTGNKYFCKPTFPSTSPFMKITPCINGSNCNTNDNNSETHDCQVGDTPPGGNYLGLRDKNGKVVFFAYDQNNACIAKKITNVSWPSPGVSYTDTGSDYKCITDPNVVIDSFKFYVYNTAYYSSTTLSTQFQPRVIFVVRGHTGSGPNSQTDFNIMTSATQRLLHSTE